VRRRFSDASTTSFMCAGRLSSPRRSRVSRIDVEAELGGDHDPIAHRRERFAHKFLVGERSINLGRIKEGDAEIHCRPNEGDHRSPLAGWPVVHAHAHATEADRGDFGSALSKFTLLHGRTSPFRTCSLPRRRQGGTAPPAPPFQTSSAFPKFESYRAPGVRGIGSRGNRSDMIVSIESMN
jgi:hypothetical protein